MTEQINGILVIGGGIGGLSAALGIAKTGKKVFVLEQASEFAEVGAGLQVGPNGTAALDELGVLEDVKKHAVFPKRLVLKNAISGEELTALNLGSAFVHKFGYPYMVMHRADLLDVFLKACQNNDLITLKTNKEVISIEIKQHQSFVACTDGSSYSAEAIVAADGLKSLARKLIIEDDMICSRYVAYRGTIPTKDVIEYAEMNDVVCWIGPGYHLVQYPVRRKELYNQVAVFKSKRYEKEIEDTNLWGTEEELKEVFNNSYHHVKKSIDHIDTSRRWPLFDREPLKNWQSGNMVLLGDSAHPMLQYLAQGACQAMEDSVSIAKNIQNEDSIEGAFSAYQSERIPRTREVQKRARLFGDILHTDDPETLLLREAILQNRVKEDFLIVDWLYGKRKSTVEI